MLKFIIISIQFLLIVILGMWAVNNSYNVSLEYEEYVFSTSSSYLITLSIFLLIIIFFIQNIYFRFKNGVLKYKNNKILNNKEKGYNSFVAGMIALANKDFRKVVIESNKVSKYLKDTSLNLLLKSETYKIEKKYDELNSIYEKMIKNDKTKLLGLRGLMEQNLKAQDFHHALIYGENLFKISPYIEKIYETLVYIIGKTKNWQNLLNINERAVKLKIIDKSIYSENKSIALYEIAKIKQFSEPKESLKLMSKSLELRKNFAPYVSFYIDMLIDNGKLNFAKKFVTKIWNESPHPDYKPQIKKLSEKMKISYNKLVNEITLNSKFSPQSKIFKAEALLENEKWDEAKKELSSLLEHQPEREVCLLMSKIEEGDSNDPQKVNAWISRANFGKLSNIWICKITNVTQENWSSVSETGYFNSLEWKSPKELNITLDSSFQKNIIDYLE